MLKVRLQGTAKDIKWFLKMMQRDLCDIWDGKLDYIDKRDQLTDDNKGMYCHEEYEVVYQKLNEIMSEYF